MASTLFSRASVVVAASTIRRRLPLVGAFCMLSLGLSNLCPSLSYSSFKTGSVQSLPFAPLLRSKFGTLSSSAKPVDAIKMEGSSDTVPSIVVYVTVPDRETDRRLEALIATVGNNAGKSLAGSLVKEKLAACVNIVPGIESVYSWEGKIHSDAEELLIIKTRQSLLEAVIEHVKANHKYDVPEVISLPITGGSPQYLEWLKNSTRD